MIASSIGSRDSSLGGSQGDRGVEFGPTQHFRRQWGRQASRVSGNKSQGGRTRSRSILKRNQLLTSVIGTLGDWDRGCLSSGGNIRVKTWKGRRSGWWRQQRYHSCNRKKSQTWKNEESGGEGGSKGASRLSGAEWSGADK